MESVLHDLRTGLRTLAARPGFTAAAVLTLALGIGGTTAIFTVVRGVLLRPLSYAAPDRIVQLWNPWTNEPGAGPGRSALSPFDIIDARDAVGSFERIAAYAPASGANLTGSDTPERVTLTRATADLFGVLGADALIGRTFTVDEDAPGGGDVVVLSHGLWQRRFGGDPAVLASVVRLDGAAHRVVGVMPPSFRMPADLGGGAATEVWKPLGLDRQDPDPGNHWLHALARLRPDATLAGANTELAALTERWIEEGIKIRDLPPYYAVDVESELFGSIRPALFVLFGAVAFVLLIACVNVANLLTIRADERRVEMALRAALGAGRGRLVSQVLTESVVLALLGAGVGLIFAWVGVAALSALEPANIPRVAEVAIDPAVLAFTLALALGTALAFGALPAVQAARADLAGGLRSHTRTTTAGRGRQRFRSALGVSEIALSAVLLIGAGLMIRTVGELVRVDLGFRPDDVLSFTVSLPAADYPTPEDRVRFHGVLTERLAALPGVRAAGAARTLPLTGRLGGGSIEMERAAPPRPGEGMPNARWQVVSPGYFTAMGYTRTAGRFVEPTDRAGGLPVVVVNETAAKLYWPSEQAVGQRVRTTNEGVPWFTVVGVVRDVRHSGIVDQPSPTLYFPLDQMPLTRTFTPTAMSFALGTTADPRALVGAVREAIHSLDGAVPISEVRPMGAVVDDALAQPRFTMQLLSIFAAVALILALVGIYGLLSYMVTQRWREIGIRIALGAPSTAVLWLVVGRGLRLAALGIAIGLTAALLLVRLLESLLYGVQPVDPLTFAVVPAIFSLVALGATYLPARRASSADPMLALRHE